MKSQTAYTNSVLDLIPRRSYYLEQRLEQEIKALEDKLAELQNK